jgi:hypothetical protein
VWFDAVDGGAVMSDAVGEFEVRGGGEDPVREVGDLRVTHAHGDQSFRGAIEAEGRVDWLMCYRADRTATFVGVQSIEGALDGRRGSFVLTSVGDHDGRESRGRWEIVEGSGTHELAGISGSGSWHAGPGPQGTYRLSYEIGTAEA